MAKRIIVCLALAFAACERTPPSETAVRLPEPPIENTAAQTVAKPAPEPWRFEGELLGTTQTRVLVLTDEIVSLDIETGELSATATTAASDPLPSFDHHLPRLGEESVDTHAVDRLVDMPIYVGGEVVTFMRGSEEAVTAVVGLDATTLEEAWVRHVAHARPLRTCATSTGVLLVPKESGPSRFVDWLGQQIWLREFGDPDEKAAEIACGEDSVTVVMERGSKRRIRKFDAGTGDLISDDAELPAPYDRSIDPRIRARDGVIVSVE